MNMTKRVVSMFLALFLLCGILPYEQIGSVLAEVTEASEYAYEIVDGEVIITDYTGDDVKVVVPSTIEGYPVREIGEGAFDWCDRIEYLIIPDSVTWIGGGAFRYCKSLVGVVLPANLTLIAEDLFKECISLMDVTIPSGVATIGSNAFYGCESLETVTIPASVTSIGFLAFARNPGMKELIVEEGNPVFYSEGNCLIDKETTTVMQGCKASVIPEGVTAIGAYAFHDNAALEHITIPAGVTRIESSAFQYCYGLKSIELCDTLETIGTYAFHFCYSLENLSIPSSVTHIAEYAFNSCYALTSLTIPSNVQSVGAYAFSFCNALTDVAICDGVMSLDSGAFLGCESLPDISIPESVEYVGEYMFADCPALTDIYCAMRGQPHTWHDAWLSDCSAAVHWSSEGVTEPEEPEQADFYYEITENGEVIILGYKGSDMNVVIPSTIEGYPVTKIGNNAFYKCGGVTSVTIPEGVTSIGNSAFYGCDGLTSITIPTGVTSIGNGAFYACCMLTEIVLHEGVISIGNEAFRECYMMQSAVLPSGLQSIGARAFYGCEALESLVIPSSVNSIGTLALCRMPALQTLAVEDGNEVYYSAGNCVIEKATGTLIFGCGASVIPDGITAIGTYAFYECAAIESVILPEGVTSIGDSAFALCYALTNVVLPESVESIGNEAFYLCHSMPQFNLPDGLISIGATAFMSCNGLTSVTVPQSVQTVGAFAFNFCELLTDIYCEAESQPEGWDADWLFGCNATVHWGAGETEEPVDFDYEITENGEVIILGYKGSDMNVVIPSTIEGYPVVSIGDHAFYYSDVESVTLPHGLKYLEDYAFGWCHSLTDITLPETVVSIGEWAFYQSGLQSIEIPFTVESIGINAFGYCDELTSMTVAEGNEVYYSAGNCIIERASGRLVQGCSASVIPEGVTCIGALAFAYATRLYELVLPQSLVTIEDEAFIGCSALTSITIPRFVSSIGLGIFGSCHELQTIEVDPYNDVYYAEGNCIIEKVSGKLQSGCNYSVIPEGVTEIGARAFDSCQALEFIAIPDSVRIIGELAFMNCFALQSMYIPGTVDHIGAGAFDSCYWMQEIDIGYGVKSIGDGAFGYCEQVVAITIPESVESMGAHVFDGCYSLGDIYCETASQPEGWSEFWLWDCHANIHWIGVDEPILMPEGSLIPGSDAYWERYDHNGSFVSVEYLPGGTVMFYGSAPGTWPCVDAWLNEPVYADVKNDYLNIDFTVEGGSTNIMLRLQSVYGEIYNYSISNTALANAIPGLNYDWGSGDLCDGEYTCKIPIVALIKSCLLFDGSAFPAETIMDGQLQFLGVRVYSVNGACVTVRNLSVEKGTEEPETIYGDANGDGVVNGADLTRLMQYFAHADLETGISDIEIFAGADCNGDGILDGRDCVRLLRYLADFDPDTGMSSVELG